MKKIKIASMILTLALCAAVAAACNGEPPQGSETTDGYTVTVLNHSQWETQGKVEFYDLKGRKAGEAPIASGKATADLDDGTYIVSIAEAPETVDYNVVVLDPETKRKMVELTDAEQGDDFPMFQVLVAAVRDGRPLSGYQVTLCYEPEDEEGGYCLFPENTDANGLFSATANAGRFHLTLSAPGTEKVVYDGYGEISAARRFLIAEVE